MIKNLQDLFPLKKGEIMETFIVTTFCIISDYLKFIKFRDDVQAQMSTAEIITATVVAGRFFGGHHWNTQLFLKEHGYMPNMLSKSQFNRRVHSVEMGIWEGLTHALGEVFKNREIDGNFLHDSFPVPICANVRASRSKIVQGSEYWGYSATKNDYFFGARIHATTTSFGAPVEFVIAPGSYHDSNIIQHFDFDLPRGSRIHADNGCADQEYEQIIHESMGIIPIFHRKSNSKNPHIPWVDALSRRIRKNVETAFSLIQSLFPKKIHVITMKGFLLKLRNFILAHSFRFF